MAPSTRTPATPIAPIVCNLVRQENSQMNAEHVSPPKNCFRSCAGMRLKYRPCELAPSIPNAPSLCSPQRLRRVRGRPKLEHHRDCQ